MKDATRSFYERCVQRVIEEIAGGLDRALRLEALAELTLLSPFHFHRVFRSMVGETALELARRLRLERAAWQLTGEQPITEIAFDAGYETHEAFSRVFRQRYGISPSEFRQRQRADGGARPPSWELAARSGVHFSPAGEVPRFQPFYSRGEVMKFPVEIEVRPELRVAAVRHVGPYAQVAAAFQKLGELAGRAGLFAEAMRAREAPKMVGLYYDDPESVPATELRADAGLVVGEGAPLPEGLSEVRIPAGRYARALHRGPYEQLGDLWARFFGEWLPQSGERMGGGPSFELYRNSPMTAKPHELETELYLPLAD